MTNKLFVWQMIRKAVEQIDSTIISYNEIRNYILSHYGFVNRSTINCQIIACSVNHPSRVHYSENKKTRLCNTQYDFLFNVAPGQVVRYKPVKHGQWAISKNDDDKLIVIQYPNIPKPSENEVRYYLDKWNSLENYTMQESALNKLFFDTYPLNTDINEVLIKVSALNDFYSTNIYSVFTVAKHIINLHIDEQLVTGDETLVNKIALVKTKNDKTKNFYSFATKYCSHHKPADYPIYDSYVDKMLKHFRDTDGFSYFKNDELKDFPVFKNILLQFREFYGLKIYNIKDIDRYLWQLGKDNFPKNYKKKQQV